MKSQDDNPDHSQENSDSIQNNEFFKTAAELFSVGEWKLIQNHGTKAGDVELCDDWIPLPEVVTYIEVSHYRVSKDSDREIWEAAVMGRWDIVKQWIERDPTQIAVTGDIQFWGFYILSDLSLFHLAFMFCTNVEVLKYLVSQGVDVNATTAHGWTPLHYAARYNSVNVAAYLVSLGVDVNAQNDQGKTPLYVAAEKNDSVDILAYLVSQGADVNAKDQYGRTPLHKAALYNSVEVVAYLVSQGADVNAKNDKGETPLHIAAYEGHLEVVQFLISQKADINAKINYGFTPLYGAVEKGHLEVVRFLVSQGADINMKTDYFCSTPLHWAARGGHLEVVQFLISQGADIHAKNKNGKTPLDVARDENALKPFVPFVDEGEW